MLKTVLKWKGFNPDNYPFIEFITEWVIKEFEDDILYLEGLYDDGITPSRIKARITKNGYEAMYEHLI